MKIHVGDIAKLFNISKQTIRYYDKIGLFKPKGIEENGYRYYKFEQYDELDIILFLKKTGMSLESIREYMERRSAQNSIALLEEQNEKLNRQIKELKEMQKNLNRKVKYIKKWIDTDRNQAIEIRHIAMRHVLAIKNELKLGFEDFMEKSLLEAMKLIQTNYNLYNNTIGVTVNEKDLIKGEYQGYNSVYVELDKQYKNELYTTIPAGDYVCMYHSGAYEDTRKTYKIMTDYIKENKYEVIGDAIEDSLIYSFFTKDEQDFLTEIQIPIKKIDLT